MALTLEPEVVTGRLPFRSAQAALGVAGVAFAGQYRLGWYGTRVSEERGSFCIVNADGPLAALVGDRLRFLYGTRLSVVAYCLGSAELPYDIGVTRRVFAAVERLAVDSITVKVEVLA